MKFHKLIVIVILLVLPVYIFLLYDRNAVSEYDSLNEAIDSELEELYSKYQLVDIFDITDKYSVGVITIPEGICFGKIQENNNKYSIEIIGSFVKLESSNSDFPSASMGIPFMLDKVTYEIVLSRIFTSDYQAVYYSDYKDQTRSFELNDEQYIYMVTDYDLLNSYELTFEY